MAVSKTIKEYSTVISYHLVVTVSARSEKEAHRKFSDVWEELDGSIPSKQGFIEHVCTTQEVIKQRNLRDASKEFLEKWEESLPMW